MGEPNWNKAPDNPCDRSHQKDIYYVVYPDKHSTRSLHFEAFDNIVDARKCCKELDKGSPPRDFMVFKGPIVGHVLEDSFQEF